jgi:L-asparaginase
MHERPLLLLAAGGTIAMTGDGGVTPELDAGDLVAAVRRLDAVARIEARTVVNVPGALMRPADQLAVCRAARDAAREGAGVVVTHGTDTLEETALLCDLLHDADAPVVFTGAIRPASAAGADGPANLSDALAVAGSAAAAGLGTLVVFGGEVHHARCARKTDTASPAAFSSPQAGPLGRVGEGRVTITARVERNAPLDPAALEHRVFVIPAVAGDDGALARAALRAGPDGVVVETLGAGHLRPELLALWADAAERIPVVACCRPQRGPLLHETYGFDGSEQDLRASAIVPAPFLSMQAARMKLLACLGAGLAPAALREAFRQDDF